MTASELATEINLGPQNRAVIDHLRANKSLTTWTAFDLYGITRLGSRIHDLRKAGYQIISTPMTGGSRGAVEYSLA